MSDAGNFVAEVNPNIEDSDPSCHVCGAVMRAMGECVSRRLRKFPHVKMKDCHGWKLTFWKCLSCGTTTECT